MIDKQLPFIERNFHILNDDRFIMEKISLPVEQEDGEDIHAAINRTREIIVQNFKAAYPHVEKSLNFHVVRQEKTNGNHFGEVNNMLSENVKWVKDADMQPKQINKGSIEEPDIEKIKEEIKNFKKSPALFHAVYGRYKNDLLFKDLYQEKLEELKNKTVKP